MCVFVCVCVCAYPRVIFPVTFVFHAFEGCLINFFCEFDSVALRVEGVVSVLRAPARLVLGDDAPCSQWNAYDVACMRIHIDR